MRNVDIEWHAPWVPVLDSTAEVLTGELDEELSSDHPLRGILSRIIGRRLDQNDVLCATCDASHPVAVVHLTWSGHTETPPWPRTEFFSSLEQLEMRMYGDGLVCQAPEGDQVSDQVTLWRPVGPKELELIRASGWREFPPRLPDQPIFYPVTNLEYARQIARDWNVPASGSGFVTRFQVRADFLRRYPKHVVGNAMHEEYWVPAGDLAELNVNIIGLIEVVEEFHQNPP